ncbi:NACHT domain-containing protein [Alkalinema pantanalense CENA528]|uniref:NACHT domain-containing protein n=1 Tax=Alkalinema pantanalense TaxID=1620705 RepID=UPI003D6ED098
MVFTTRDLSLGGDLGIEKRFKMQPLSDRQMRDFVEKYLPEQGNRLLGQLRDRLREIAETPLLLKMLCDVFKQTEQIPQNKGELFRWFDREYDRFKGLPAVSAEFRRFKSEVLQYLAFAMMQGDSRTEFWLTIDRGRAESLIEEWLTGRVSDPAEKAKEWLEDLLEHHLLQVAADGRRVEFHHQLFLEYYAAEHFWQALERHSNWLEKQEGEEFSWFQQHYLNNLKWTEPISLMLGLPEVDRRSAVEIVEQALAIDLILGAKLAGAVIEEIQKMLMPRLLNLPLSDVIKLELLRATKSLLAIEFILQIFRKSPAKLSQLTASILRDLNAEKQCDYHKDLKTALDSIDFWNQFLGCDWSENDRKRIEEDFWEGVYYICIESDEFDLNEDIHIFASNLCDSKRDWRDLRVTIQNGIYHSNPRIRSIAIEAAGIFYLEEAQTFSPDMLQTPVSEVHQTSIRAAEKDDFTNIVDCLLNQWEIEQNDQVKTVLENVLSNLNQPVYLKFLYNSWTQNDSWQFFHAFQTIQESCKFYNYEIYQKALARSALDTQQFSPANTIHFAGDYIAGDKVGRDKILGDKNEAPNASEVKIFEQIDNYHESPRDPPS